MHRTRLISAAILIPLLIAYIMYLPPVFFLVLMMAVTFIGQFEFYTLFGVGRKYRVIGLVAGLGVLYYIYRDGAPPDDYVMVFFIVIALLRLFGKRDPQGATREVAYTLTGLVYVPFLLGYQIKLREFGPHWIIYLDACVWGADSLAYYMGKSLGRRKLYREVSPNKTVEGAYGSVIGAIAVSLLFNRLLSVGLTLKQAVVVGGVIGVVSIVGDLVESMFKRDSGIKDSGSIIPGHGGILDKIDGIVFVSPVLYWIVSRIIVV